MLGLVGLQWALLLPKGWQTNKSIDDNDQHARWPRYFNKYFAPLNYVFYFRNGVRGYSVVFFRPVLGWNTHPVITIVISHGFALSQFRSTTIQQLAGTMTSGNVS
jgi:hypothetical protein